MARYSYGKKTKVRAAAPPVPERIGDQERQRRLRNFEAMRGRDGGKAAWEVPGNPMRAPVYPWTKKGSWRGSQGLDNGARRRRSYRY